MVTRPDVEEFAELLTRPRWHLHAACRDVPHADRLFFPARGEVLDDARRICAGCPVRQACLDEHLAEHHGIWGGMSDRERRHERARRLAAGETWVQRPVPYHDVNRCRTDLAG